MKAFTWKIVFCVVPVVLSVLIVVYACYQYLNGEGGFSFKLGVDLAGGTDLIYAIDLDKFPNGELPASYSPQELAAALKRRIDPADLYNVTIRPVSNTRVEIILPTGGQHEAAAEQRVWDDFLKQVAGHWPPKGYQAVEGHKTELLAQINAQHDQVPLNEIHTFIDENYKPVAADPQKSKDQWNELLRKASEKWKPGKYDVGPGRLQVLVNAVHAQYPEESVQGISDFIDEHYKVSKERRRVSSEEVAHIKELISRVGSLEFRILANTTDDKDGIDAAKKFFAEAQKNPKSKTELDSLAVAGKPPPPPLNDQGGMEFTTGNDGDHSYSWVELGMSERQALGLNNSAASDSKREAYWKTVAETRAKGETIPILNGECLLYSRDVLNPRLPEKDADKKYEYFILTRDPQKGKDITGKYLTNAYETTGRAGDLEVGFRFNTDGAELFRDVTAKNAPSGEGEGAFHRYLAVVLDGKIESAPRLNGVIPNGEGVIEGRFTKEEVDRLVTVLRSGALPASLKPQPVSESTMGATLGQDTIRAGTESVLIAFAFVLLFMIVYYRFAGVVACIALLANLLLTVAFMVLVHATFTLPGLAGLVLMLGMAVDANVLIYERLREERDRGASLPLALRNGYDRAFPTIIDTHLTSIFTAIVLYAVGNDQLKGFGISLTVGLIISLFTSLYMTRLLFDLWQYKGWLRKLSMFRLLSKPNIDFMAIRYYWFTATIVLTVVGAAVFMYRLEHGGLNIDFTSGTAYSAQLREKVTLEELRDLLKKSKLPDLSVEQIFVNDPALSEGDRSALFTVRTSDGTPDHHVVAASPEEVQADVNALLVDPKTGQSLLKNTNLSSYSIDPNDKRATLSFSDPADPSHGPAFASRAQVSMILAREFTAVELPSVAEQFVLEGLGQDKDGRFQWMELQLLQPINRAKFEEVLKLTQNEFAARPQPERLENFDSQLAKETQLRALYAILASWGAILLYLWFRFGNWTFGVATVLCLIHDLFFTLGMIGFCHYIHAWMPGLASALLIQDFKIDLPTVAALLTLVGYSVSDTIVVFDRIREVRGKNPLLTPQMINDSVNQTLSRTLLTAFSVWLVVTVLYIFGGPGVHLFSFVMVIGVIVGTYSSIYIASPLLLIFGEGAPKKTLRPRAVAAQPATV